MRAVGIDLYRLQHRGRGAAGAQASQFMLERLGCALHAALQFVNVELTRGHHALPCLANVSPLDDAHTQPATTVPRPIPRKIAPIEPDT